MNITDRFLKYVSFHTTSDENTHTTPSTARQLELGKYLREELIGLGLEEVELDGNGYLSTSERGKVDRESAECADRAGISGAAVLCDRSRIPK